MRRALLVLVVAAAVAVPAASAAASAPASGRATCGGRHAVATAVKASNVAGLNQSATDYVVRGVRFAGSWALFQTVAKPAFRDSFQDATGLARCVGGTWTVTDVGTAEVGCPGGTNPVPPKAVRKRFRLTCPPA